MASSYLPAGVKVNCTFMTNGVPNELGVSRSKYTVAKVGGSEVAVLLNIDDKKISASFKCKVQQSFWGGLVALCAGIAIAAAVVFSGGLVLVAIVAAVAVAACVATPHIVGFFQAKHPCDCTLQASSQWINSHRTVRINGANAILQQSFLKCTKGGIVQPFLNTQIAIAVASKFTKQNNEQTDIHMGSEFLQGVITVAAAGANPVAAVLGAGLMIGEYVDPNLFSIGGDSTGGAIATGGRDYAIGTAAGVKPGIDELNTNMIEDLTKQGASEGLAEELESAFGYTLKDLANADVGKLLLKQMKPDLIKGGVGAVAIIGIDKGADAWTDSIADDVKKESEKYAAEDRKDNIGIIANNP